MCWALGCCDPQALPLTLRLHTCAKLQLSRVQLERLKFLQIIRPSAVKLATLLAAEDLLPVPADLEGPPCPGGRGWSVTVCK